MGDELNRATKLSTVDLYELDRGCILIRRAFGHCPYLVGSAESGPGGYRDVDVRLMLDESEFDATCPSLVKWQLLCRAISSYLRECTGLPIDFQIQRTDIGNRKHGRKARNALGVGRVFAGGGDATPFDAHGIEAAE